MAKEREPIITFDKIKKSELQQTGFGLCEIDGNHYVAVLRYDPISKEAKVESLLYGSNDVNEVRERFKIEVAATGILG